MAFPEVSRVSGLAVGLGERGGWVAPECVWPNTGCGIVAVFFSYA